MAVYTQVSDEQIALFLEQHYAAQLISVQAIHEGTENSNYLLHAKHLTSDAYFVLTLFESISSMQLNNCLSFVSYLTQTGFAVAAPIRGVQNTVLHQLAAKPCILTPFIHGQHPKQATPQQCTAIATTLAGIHIQPQHDFSDFEDTILLTSLEEKFNLVKNALAPDEYALILNELKYYQHYSQQMVSLPKGIIHNDLFRDNTLFAQDQLRAVLDFYSASRGVFIYDLAVVVNDWCFMQTMNQHNTPHLEHFSTTNYRALLTSYQSVRTLSASELQLLPLLIRMAACRFWLSRLILQKQLQNNSSHSVVASKNPEQFKCRLAFHIKNTLHLKPI